ncbi:alpha/beta hydrolase [Streptomyces sp. NPDC051572]|uniref:alpha/beta fold hydrolase n=1 Tax=unclassified Streptomyces TaxID=2593676 RepID=UPI00344DD222
MRTPAFVRPDASGVPGLDGATIAVHDLGGDGPALLFSHATGLHGLVWEPVARQLTERFHCWSLDLRGHGDSALPPHDDLNWAGFGRDVRAALAAIGRTEVIGIGHSLGGVALVMAALSEPGAFRQLVLFEPAMRAATTALSPEELHLQDLMARGAAARRPAFASRAEALANYARKAPMSQFQAASLLAYVEHGFAERPHGGGVELKCRPEVEARVFEQTHQHDTARQLRDVRCPTVIVKGALTDRLQQASADAVADALGAEVVELDGMDHFGPLAQPERFAALITRVLGVPGS